MARPQKLQRLRHGRILSAGAFPGFVATWNWICRVICSWVGDRENGGDGFIFVDRTNEDAPVIRLDLAKLNRRINPKNLPDYSLWRIVGGSASAEVTDPETGETETIFSGFHYIDNQYYMVGGMLFEGTDQTTLESFIEDGKHFIAAKVEAVGDGSYSSLVGYETFFAMRTDSRDRTFSLIPLYEIDKASDSSGGNIEIVVKTDFRAIPLVQAFELPTEGGVA